MDNVHYSLRSQEDQKAPGYIDALTNPYYRRATWVAMALAFFNQVSGVASLNLYSSNIFSLIIKNGTTEIPVQTWTVYVGLAQLAGAVLAPCFSTKTPTRIIIIGG